ncbi:Asp23/Gls24 family envelope stress response protein [Serpentinicella sp. ANB-PHB4]|uniref:Asp23/Gls24 family envelope stress response protein n=1 Tax=Serpentinicella sp. ANB-PHB4 TaxID=3074076 RepID=UPI00285472B9|nr:Asp23/Gls24 family envelope stress response protein [Serpentinicella sp. ANB-PHB4]MDR5658311.1 Asp23/Gls24 family envelope stress response protein [Serpentinicella sp. ANB-PHB4]
MPGKLVNNLGIVTIDDHVLASIAGVSAMECYGLVGMAAKSTAGGLVELLKRDQLSKGVKVQTEEDEIVIDLFVIVEFGTRISVVATNIIEKVKYNIENLTGMSVKKVNINVQGVRVQK